jgi:hypothetical protein
MSGLGSCLVVAEEPLSEVVYSPGSVGRSRKAGNMARLARVVAVGVPHHATQRGNARQFSLGCDADRNVYLDR